MTTTERALQVIIATLPECKGRTFADAGRLIITRLTDSRIALSTMIASPDLFTRWHAHCRYLGLHGGEGYRHWYNAAIEHAMEIGDWPSKLIQRTVTVSGQDITVDVEIPESTKLANNRQLLLAYEVITDAAAEKGLHLPENVEDV